MERTEKKINEFTDLELAQAQGNLYQQLMQIQGNLIAINEEIKRRKDLVNPVIEEVK